MEVNRIRVPTLGSWKACVPVPFCRLTPLTTSVICSWVRQEHTLVCGAFTVFVNDS